VGLNSSKLPFSKERQLHSVRVRPTQKQMGDISPKVRKEVRERSGGVCELCRSSEALQMAHLIGRKQLTGLTTAKILLHVCIPCHKYLDEDPKGIKLKRRLAE
jgi:hypothetical protein